jgi:hypothetical protein
MVYLARRDGVTVVSPEPDRAWEAEELAKEFGRHKVVLYYFIRQLAQWSTHTEEPDIETEGAKMLRLMQKTFGWDDVDFSISGMQSLHEKVLNKPLLIKDRQWFYDLTTPATREYITNEIARRSGQIRDEHILEVIKKYWQQGKSPFIVYGSAHAICMEPALRKL